MAEKRDERRHGRYETARRVIETIVRIPAADSWSRATCSGGMIGCLVRVAATIRKAILNLFRGIVLASDPERFDALERLYVPLCVFLDRWQRSMVFVSNRYVPGPVALYRWYSSGCWTTAAEVPPTWSSTTKRTGARARHSGRTATGGHSCGSRDAPTTPPSRILPYAPLPWHGAPCIGWILWRY